MMERIAVLGAGSWGTTIALILAQNGHDVRLWARRQEIVSQIQNGENTEYLPGVKIPKNVKAETSMQKCVEGASILFSVIPSEFLRQTMKDLSSCYNGQVIVSATKGFEHSTGKRMTQIIEDEIKGVKTAVLSGPNHAEEVSQGKPTASVVASKDRKAGQKVCAALNSMKFKTYYVNDTPGVEICAALKNITAIATGVCDGFNLGDNAKASIITLGLMEMNNFGRHFGAKRGTFYGLAGVGDLIATCMSKHSRNRFVGENLAKGRSLDSIRAEMKGMVAEGVPTARAVYDYSKKHGIKLPLTEQIYEVLYKNKDMKKAVSDLLQFI
jgi:glycerol-3-phosphate dehydrogenase (NAD(P)+)